MKLITLNTWGGKAGLTELLDFFKAHRETDVFCLQEVWNGGQHMLTEQAAGQWLDGCATDLMTHITRILPDHQTFFHPHFQEHYGLLTLVHKRHEVVESGDVFVYKERGYVSTDDHGNHARNLQYTTLRSEHGPMTICNLHGLWNGGGKGDCPERILQSENILRTVASFGHPYVVAGDFNLEPNTESMAILERAGMRNLVKEYGVTSTRTRFYTKPIKFADYIMVSDGLDVQGFAILPDEVSDHAPLYCELFPSTPQ